VFRPNIRGVPRSKLRPNLRGWILMNEPRSLIRYRVPWRRSWVHDVHQSPNLRPLLSRAGSVHLQEPQDNYVSNAKRPRLWIFSFFLISCLAFGLFIIRDTKTVPKTSESPAQANLLTTKSACQKYLADPKLLISDEVDLTEVSGMQANFSNELIYGGIRSRVVHLICNSTAKDFRSIEVMSEGVWRLKNLLQLDN